MSYSTRSSTRALKNLTLEYILPHDEFNKDLSKSNNSGSKKSKISDCKISKNQKDKITKVSKEITNAEISSNKCMSLWEPYGQDECGKEKTLRKFCFTSQQSTLLNEFFEKNKYPNKSEKQIIAQLLNVSKQKVTEWFKRKRRGYVKIEISSRKEEMLEKFYDSNNNPTLQEMENIANIINLRNEEVLLWFNRQRKFDTGQARKSFKDQQLSVLNEWFKKTYFPNKAEIKNIASLINDSEKRVQVWFRNQRNKDSRFRNSAEWKRFKSQVIKKNSSVELKEFHEKNEVSNFKENDVVIENDLSMTRISTLFEEKQTSYNNVNDSLLAQNSINKSNQHQIDSNSLKAKIKNDDTTSIIPSDLEIIPFIDQELQDCEFSFIDQELQDCEFSFMNDEPLFDELISLINDGPGKDKFSVTFDELMANEISSATNEFEINDIASVNEGLEKNEISDTPDQLKSDEAPILEDKLSFNEIEHTNDGASELARTTDRFETNKNTSINDGYYKDVTSSNSNIVSSIDIGLKTNEPTSFKDPNDGLATNEISFTKDDVEYNNDEFILNNPKFGFDGLETNKSVFMNDRFYKDYTFCNVNQLNSVQHEEFYQDFYIQQSNDAQITDGPLASFEQITNRIDSNYAVPKIENNDSEDYSYLSAFRMMESYEYQ